MGLTNSNLLKDGFAQVILDLLPIGSEVKVYSSDRTLLVTVAIVNSTFTRTLTGVSLSTRPPATVLTSGLAHFIEFSDPQGRVIFTSTCGTVDSGEPIVFSNATLNSGTNFILEKIDYNF